MAALPAAAKTEQLIVVGGMGKTTAWISIHQKDKKGSWHQVMTTPDFIGKEGLGKVKEGDGKSPVGTFRLMHCFGPKNPFTGGCIAVPKDKMVYVMKHVQPDCLIVIDSLKNLEGNS